MFLYVGEGRYKRLSSLIGVFDMDSATVCVATRRFLAKKEKDGQVESDGELPKSFLLCESGEKQRSKKRSREKEKNGSYVYLSKLASGVLVGRTARFSEE